MKFEFKQNQEYIEVYLVTKKSFWFGTKTKYIGLARDENEIKNIIERYKAAAEAIKQLESKYGQ